VGSDSGLAWTLSLVFAAGAFAYALNRLVQISTVPLLLLLGMLVGPVLGLIHLDDARAMFDQVRIIGLVIILFTAGYSLKWPLLRRHLGAIALLDTVALLITAAGAGLLFCWVFDAPLLIGLLFGAMVSATDPATLIPLFKEARLQRDVETTVITESVFNDPLSIVLVTLAIALLLPDAAPAWMLQQFSAVLGLYPAAVVYFLYTLLASLLVGIVLGWVTHRTAMRFTSGEIPILFGLAVAFGGYVGAEWIHASGFLATTTIGIIIGNHRWFFAESREQSRELEAFLSTSEGFEEPLADFATIFIFVLLGASLDPALFSASLWPQAAIAVGLVLLVRPLGVFAVLLPGRWSWRQSLFIGLEGPRGVVPAAMAGVPLSLGITYQQALLTQWGEALLTTTLMCIFVSVLLSSSWMGRLGRGLGVIDAASANGERK